MKNSTKILIVDDEADTLEFINYHLSSLGYEVKVALNGKLALEILQSFEPELILVDYMMPEMDGLSFLRHLKSKYPNNEYKIAFLTAKTDDQTQMNVLDSGADDYVTKPFGMMELISRIKAVLRRSGKQQDKTKLSVGGISLDTKKHEVKVDGEQVVLTLKEFELLEKLMRNQGIVLTRDQLLTEIWGYDFDGETRTVDVHIRTLRQKLGEQGSLVKTVRGVGYRIGGEA